MTKVRPDPVITATTIKAADTTVVVKFAMQCPELEASDGRAVDGRATIRIHKDQINKYTARYRAVLTKIQDAIGEILDEHAIAMEGRPGMVPPDIEGQVFITGDSFSTDSPRQRQERARSIIADALKEPK